jgi:hypothetical protein
MRIKLAVAMIMMVGLTTPAFGDDSGGNIVYIKQSSGDGLDLTITQTGFNNSLGDELSLIAPEFNFEGDNILASISQNGINNKITGNIVGSGTIADIEQTGSSNEFIFNMGASGSSDGNLVVKATGDDNRATLNIATTSNASGYSVNAIINGGGNQLISNINSKYASVDITSTGDNNDITTTQSGFVGAPLNPGHDITISNVGSGNSISVTQDAITARNSANVTVNGTNASVTINQH